MVSASDTSQCVNEDAGPHVGWIVRSYIGWREERNIPYKSVEISLYQTRFKTLKRSLKEKAQREQHPLAVGLDSKRLEIKN